MTRMTLTKLEVGSEALRELPENVTVTEPLPEEAVREEIERVVDLAEDLALAVVIRTRIEQDTGERVPIADFIRREGFDPADFGV